MGLKCAQSFLLMAFGAGTMLSVAGCSAASKSVPMEQAKALPRNATPKELPWVVVPADQAKWRLGFTTDRAIAAGPVLEWSASSAELAFEGTGIRVALRNLGDSRWEECAWNVVEVVIDGKDTIDHVVDSDNTPFELEGLAEGAHRIKIAKRTEALCGRTAIGDIAIRGAMLAPPPEPQRRILFVGGSVTCGWGVMDNDPDPAFRPQSESGTASYAAEASKRLGADFASVCASGRGLLWNYDGKTIGRIPELWKKGTLQKDAQGVRNEPAPDAVVVELGMLELQAGMPDQAAFTRAYVDFVMDIHRRWPKAWIVGVDAPALDEDKLSALRGFLIPVDQWVRGRRQVKNFSRLFLTQQGTLGYGGGGHPNRGQSAMNGEELADHLQGRLGWNQTASSK